MHKYHQGRFTPTNPEKYVGDIEQIIFRSSYERKLLEYLDKNPNVLKYGSEELIIPYYSRVDQKVRRYFPDFIVQYRNTKGDIEKAVIEVKPLSQTKPPKMTATGRSSKRYIRESLTYAVNSDKWQAAEAWCQKNGFKFIIMTEVELNI
jgi:hypothetical protein